MPTSEVAFAFSPPLPNAISTSPTPTPVIPGISDSAMCPHITSAAA